jgi:hypothetical protein
MGAADALLAAYTVWCYSEERHELLYQLQRLLADAQARKSNDAGMARQIARHVRRCWQHAIFDRHEAAKTEFRLAELEYLRLSSCVLGETAGKAFLQKQTAQITGRKGPAAKQEGPTAKAIQARHDKIINRAKLMKGSYSKTEALDILEREFPFYGRRNLSKIVSSVFPKRGSRAK